MAHISTQEANVWADHVKLNLDELDADLEDSVSMQVIAQASQAYTVDAWVDEVSTPQLIKKIIAMWYVAWYFQRTYSEDDGINTYGVMLLAEAKNLLAGIIAGTIVLPDAGDGSQLKLDQPLFYPTDLSSSVHPDSFGAIGFDRSAGPAKFSMGEIF